MGYSPLLCPQIPVANVLNPCFRQFIHLLIHFIKPAVHIQYFHTDPTAVHHIIFPFRIGIQKHTADAAIRSHFLFLHIGIDLIEIVRMNYLATLPSVHM